MTLASTLIGPWLQFPDCTPAHGRSDATTIADGENNIQLVKSHAMIWPTKFSMADGGNFGRWIPEQTPRQLLASKILWPTIIAHLCHVRPVLTIFYKMRNISRIMLMIIEMQICPLHHYSRKHPPFILLHYVHVLLVVCSLSSVHTSKFSLSIFPWQGKITRVDC